jgi:hypothetical protein
LRSMEKPVHGQPTTAFCSPDQVERGMDTSCLLPSSVDKLLSRPRATGMLRSAPRALR